MRKGICLRRHLTMFQSCRLNKNGIIIHTKGDVVMEGSEERLTYGSYMMTIFVGNIYIGRSKDIILWGPLTLTQLQNMYIIAELPESI